MKKEAFKRIFAAALCLLLLPAVPLTSSGAEGETASEQTWQLTGQVSGTTIPYGIVEVYGAESGLVAPLGGTVADRDGNFTFTFAEPLTGKQVLLIVSDAAGNTSAFTKAVKAE